MSASLLDGLTGLMTPEVVGKAASLLGESDAAILKGVSGTIPALLSGLTYRTEDFSFASSLIDLVRSPANDGGILSDVGSLFDADSTSPAMILGDRLLGLLFGDSAASFTKSLAGYAGVKSSTAVTLLSVAAPLVLAIIGRHAHGSLNASSLATLLRSQKHAFAAAVPGQLSNAGRYQGTPMRERPVYTGPLIEERTSTWRWVLPALAALAAIAVFFPQFGREDQAVDRVQTAATIEPALVSEYKLVAPRVAAPTVTVYFDVNQSAPPADVIASLSSVIKYLKANPGATAVVSGYQDPSGNQAVNEELARSRADSVRSTLVAAGIEESRIEMQKRVVTEGAGPPEKARRVEVTAS